ncbi:hypothetical protein [Amycolatopsis jejuensis]|uniref:hypothetical protein n=1 Tax=Amycolatopsis jejuensis TaxID=330084 RepID=UPI000689E8A8|nr:hypothetical protein [Amycolatopsis jejuensis]
MTLTDEQKAALKKLRRKFPNSAVRQRPIITCPACELLDRDQPGAVCAEHEASHCESCGEVFTVAHEHLDYVGHAHIRERLIEADPGWDWEPLGRDDNGNPVFDSYGGLWIRLTVAGVSRLGYGDAEGRRGTAATKEVIGDALRNAGQSFGMALDLWKTQSPRRRRAARPPARAAVKPVDKRDADAIRGTIRNYASRRFGWALPQIDANFTCWAGGLGGETFATAPADLLDRYREHLDSTPDDGADA